MAQVVPTDPVLAALDGLVAALAENIEASRAAMHRAQQIRDLRLAGLTYREVAHEVGRPLAVEMITENIERLMESGAALRKSHAKALHEEGLTMSEIARLFGVSRQRVSAILKGGA